MIRISGRAGWLAGLALFTLAVRLPFWFDAVNVPDQYSSWDESTFIIIGQAVLDGVLPYTQHYDLKPPFLYYAFAGILWLCGEDIAAVRAAGSAIVFGCAAATFLLTERLAGRAAAGIAGVLCVMALSIASINQAVLSTQLAALPLMAAVAWMARPRLTTTDFVWIGLLLGSATLVRLNLAIVALALTAMAALHPGAGGPWRAGGAVVAGGLLALLAAFVPHLVAGEVEAWWRGAVLAPFAYAGAQHGLATTALRLLHDAYLLGGKDTFIHLVVTGFGLTGLALLPVFTRQRESSGWHAALVPAALGATMLSIFLSGGAYGHYLAQAMPLFAVLAGAAMVATTRRLGRAWPVMAIPAALLLMALGPVATQYRALATRVAETGTPYWGRAFDITETIRALPLERPTVLALSDHLIYWTLRTPPPTPMAVHPSNLFRPYLIRNFVGPAETPASQIEAAFATRPTLVVKAPTLWYAAGFPTEEALITRHLEPYRLIDQVDGTEIWVRREAM